MTNTLTSTQSGRSFWSIRPLLTAAAVTAFALILVIGTGIWQVQRRADPRATTGRAVPEATAGTVARSLPSENAAGGLSTESDDTWQSFRRLIQQPAQHPLANDLPAYELPLGITSEEQVNGVPVVKRLVLDLGDLSVHSVDLAAP